MKPDFHVRDDTELARFFWDGDVLHRLNSSLTEDRIMRENKELAGTIKDLAWCRPVLRMSMAQYTMLCRVFPDFRPGGDPVARRRILQTIARDPDFRDLVIGKA